MIMVLDPTLMIKALKMNLSNMDTGLPMKFLEYLINKKLRLQHNIIMDLCII